MVRGRGGRWRVVREGVLTFLYSGYRDLTYLNRCCHHHQHHSHCGGGWPQWLDKDTPGTSVDALSGRGGWECCQIVEWGGLEYGEMGAIKFPESPLKVMVSTENPFSLIPVPPLVVGRGGP